MIASNLQVHKDALALMKLIIHYLNTSPRTLRYSLGGIIIKSMASCISEIRLANSNEGARRIEHIVTDTVILRQRNSNVLTAEFITIKNNKS